MLYSKTSKMLAMIIFIFMSNIITGLIPGCPALSNTHDLGLAVFFEFYSFQAKSWVMVRREYLSSKGFQNTPSYSVFQLH